MQKSEIHLGPWMRGQWDGQFVSVDGAYTANMSIASTKRWSDPEYRSMMSDAQRKSWSENHDERCARVFTEEFSKKISAANARRDQKRTSKVEAEFVEKLCSLLSQDDVQSSKWFNLDQALLRARSF